MYWPLPSAAAWGRSAAPERRCGSRRVRSAGQPRTEGYAQARTAKRGARFTEAVTALAGRRGRVWALAAGKATAGLAIPGAGAGAEVCWKGAGRIRRSTRWQGLGIHMQRGIRSGSVPPSTQPSRQRVRGASRGSTGQSGRQAWVAGGRHGCARESAARHPKCSGTCPARTTGDSSGEFGSRRPLEGRNRVPEGRYGSEHGVRVQF